MVTGRGVEKGHGHGLEASKVYIKDQVTDGEQLNLSSVGNLWITVFDIKGQGDGDVYLTHSVSY